MLFPPRDKRNRRHRGTILSRRDGNEHHSVVRGGGGGGVDSWKYLLVCVAIIRVVQCSSSLPRQPGGASSPNTLQQQSTVLSSQQEVVGNLQGDLKSQTTTAYDDVVGEDDDGGDDDGDDENSSSSESEYDDYISFGYPLPVAQSSSARTPISQQTTTTLPPARRSMRGKSTSTATTTSSSRSSAAARAAESRPLKTLEKLRQMLDDTDYMTARPDNPDLDSNSNSEGSILSNQLSSATSSTETESESSPTFPLQEQQLLTQQESSSQQDRLWTSADRSKYKRQQLRLRQAREEKRMVTPPPPPPPSFSTASSDDEQSDTEDGLEYTLPNLPIYLSDAEESETEEHISRHHHQHHQHNLQQQQQLDSAPQQHQAHSQQIVPPHGAVSIPDQSGYLMYPPPQTAYSVPPYSPETYGPQHPPSNGYGPNSYPPLPYMGQYNPQQQQQHQPQQHHQPQQNQQHLCSAQQQYAAWAAATGYAHPPPPYGPAHPHSWTRPPPPTIVENKRIDVVSGNEGRQKQKAEIGVSQQQVLAGSLSETPLQEPSNNQITVTINVQPQSLAEATSRINFDSIQKISIMIITGAMACYSAVSPRTLPQVEYNRFFYDNIRLVALTLIAPIITIFSVLDTAENDLNEIIQSMYTAFTMGYILVFFMEIVSTTLVRLSVFLLFEPDIFALVPKIPVVVLPWVLRENTYRPKRITIMAADFLTSCVACPFFEEYFKLKILLWTSRLPKNYVWVKKAKESRGRKKWKREKIVKRPGEKEVTTVNKYVMQMLAVSIGLKIADSGRRVLMYTKQDHADKSFYAICRGIFPIHELCGTMTALRLAKRDVLGAEMSTWWILAPAVIVHGMATLRGMKPIFKWNSATPWSEMQLFPWSAADASTLPQLATKGFSKLMWLIILLRALGYCAKNYYYTNRQAEKRTTTYAANPNAIDAALASSDLLKKTQGK